MGWMSEAVFLCVCVRVRARVRACECACACERGGGPCKQIFVWDACFIAAATTQQKMEHDPHHPQSIP